MQFTCVDTGTQLPADVTWTLSSVELDPSAYDAVVFNHSLEHTGDPVAALRAVSAALTPDGVVLITVPNFGGWQARRFAGHWYHLDLPRHRVHFTPGALERALSAAGLEAVSVSTSAVSVASPAWAGERVKSTAAASIQRAVR